MRATTLLATQTISAPAWPSWLTMGATSLLLRFAGLPSSPSCGPDRQPPSGRFNYTRHLEQRRGLGKILPPDTVACVYRLAACLLALAGGGTFFLPFFGGFTLPVGSSISLLSLAR
jgi:hypothetical protein